MFAENGRAEIRQWRQTSASEQFDWRWATRYRDMVRYDAFYWLTLVASSSAEQKEWEQLQTQERTDEQQQALEALVTRSRNREILAALSEGREPQLQYPRLSLPKVKTWF